MKLKDRVKSLRRIPANELLPNPKNWRQHPEQQANAMRGILSEIGIADACLGMETEDGVMLIDGHLRADLASDQKLPVLILDVTKEEADKILATHDVVTELAEVDEEKVADLLDAIEVESDELAQMLSDYFGDAPEDHDINDNDEIPDDPKAELLKKWKVEVGQLWVIDGRHRIACGDSSTDTVLSQLFGDQYWNLAVTSPPYNQNVGNFSKSGMHTETAWVDNTNNNAYDDNKDEQEYQAEQAAALTLWSSYAADNASLFYNHKNRYRNKSVVSPFLWLSGIATIRQEIIWLREGSVTQNMRGFMPVDERIYWIYFGDQFHWNDHTEYKTWSTVWRINSHKDREQAMHGCAFPLEIPSRAIRACSNKNDIVFEPYCGSGTTMVASHDLDRFCYAVELSPSYVAVTLERMSKLGCECRNLKT